MAVARAVCFSFLLLLLAVIWQASGRASPDSHLDALTLNDSLSNNVTKSNGKRHSKWEAYVYGTLSVTVISLLSVVGVIVIPFIKRKVTYDGVMLTFMALAVGTMTSDALLHLIPESLGLDEGHHDGEEGEHHDEEHESPLGKMIALLGTLYGLYLLELIMHSVGQIMKKKSKVAQTVNTDPPVALTVASSSGEKRNAVAEKWSTGGGYHGGHAHGHSHGFPPPKEDEEHTTILGLKTYCFVVVLSDAMHNFTDGLAVGAAYSKSSASGLGVTLAVVCHEIPHEMGNFAILLNSGMGLKKALMLNFLSAVTCFAGLYPGIVAGQQDVLARWIFAAVAAGFLYVALVHMLRELQHFGSLPWWLSLILQNLGMLVGFIVIFLLALYEEELNGMA